MMDGKTLCIIGSEYSKDFCRKWFNRCSSHPNIHFAKIPEHYVATQWSSIKEGILKQIPPDLDLCLVGAGIRSYWYVWISHTSFLFLPLMQGMY